jgi:hypothetical protein
LSESRKPARWACRGNWLRVTPGWGIPGNSARAAERTNPQDPSGWAKGFPCIHLSCGEFFPNLPPFTTVVGKRGNRLVVGFKMRRKEHQE